MKKLLSLLLAVMLLLPLFAFNASAEGGVYYGTAYVKGTANRVNLRSEPSKNSTSLGLYYTGTEVTYYSDPTEEWVSVSIGVYNGYMMSEFLSPDPVKSKQPTATIISGNGRSVNMRMEPTTGAAVLFSLKVGTKVKLVGETNTHWWYCVYQDTYGYISSDYITTGTVTKKPTATPTAKIVYVTATPRIVYVTPTPAPMQTLQPVAADDDMALLRQVLQNKSVCVDTQTGNRVLLSSLLTNTFETAMQYDRFAVMDLDNDGISEVVLSVSLNGEENSYVALDVQGGLVYAHQIPLRALLELKVDATFNYSDGAADGGCGSLLFDEMNYNIVPLFYTASDSGSVLYYNGDTAISEAAYQSAADAQARKLDAVWYEFNNAAVNALVK